MKSVTGIIPEEFMSSDRVGDVIAYLKRAPLDAEAKTHLLMAWSRQVGAKISASQRAAVAASGIDHR